MVLAVLADRLKVSLKSHKAHAQVAEARLFPGGPRLVLAKSNGYMNTSGGPVANLAKFYSVAPANIIVIHDELDIPAATTKIKHGGGHGGHNGLRDIITALGSNDFTRIRVGIGRPPGRMETAVFVLKDFSAVERKELPITLEIAADAAEAVVRDGLLAAQQKFNSPE
jgi:PTH1 family peptidyl-tRNA hydrolase